VPVVTDIDRDELKQKLDHPKKIVLVDALPEEEFRKLHLPGAINIPADQVGRLASELIPNKEVEVIVYCSNPRCHASDAAANKFNAMGYSHVRRYVGGKHDWLTAHLPVVREGDQRAVAGTSETALASS
jgi:rhodanese-related sulfurtransferase